MEAPEQCVKSVQSYSGTSIVILNKYIPAGSDLTCLSYLDFFDDWVLTIFAALNNIKWKKERIKKCITNT